MRGSGNAGWGSGPTIGAWIAIGVAMGAAMDNMGAGIAIGVAIGAAMDATRRSKGKREDGQSADEDGPNS